MNSLSIFDNSSFGFVLVVVGIIAICLVCALVRKKFKIGTYDNLYPAAKKDGENQNMKTNLELLMKEEDVEEGKDYRDEV